MFTSGSVRRRLSLIVAALVTAHGILASLPHTHSLTVGSGGSEEAVSAAAHGCHRDAVCLACCLASASSATLIGAVAVGHGGWTPAAGLAPAIAPDPGPSPHLRARSPPSGTG